MPLARIDLRRGKPAAYRQAVADGVYRALRDTFDVPEGDRFILVSEHDADGFSYDAHYFGMQRSDDLVPAARGEGLVASHERGFPYFRWIGSIQRTSSGGSTGVMWRLTTTGCWPLRHSTHSKGSSRLALISWCGTKGGT